MGCAASKKSARSPELRSWDVVESSTIIRQFNQNNIAIIHLAERLFPPINPQSNDLAHSHHFLLLAAINERFREHIFVPFHPCLPAAESRKENQFYGDRLLKGKPLPRSNYHFTLIPLCDYRISQRCRQRPNGALHPDRGFLQKDQIQTVSLRRGFDPQRLSLDL